MSKLRIMLIVLSILLVALMAGWVAQAWSADAAALDRVRSIDRERAAGRRFTLSEQARLERLATVSRLELTAEERRLTDEFLAQRDLARTGERAGRERHATALALQTAAMSAGITTALLAAAGAFAWRRSRRAGSGTPGPH